MVANYDKITDQTPQLPCSPRSFAKAHLDRLRSKSKALNSEVEELSEEFDNQADEPESLRALRAQSDILNAEVQNLEHVLQNASSDNARQEIWDAVQRALRKRYHAELVSLRTVASFSERGCTLPKKMYRASRKQASTNGSRQSSDNASSTEMPLSSTESDELSPTTSNGISSDTAAGYRSDDSASMENSTFLLGTVAPKPKALPSPKWVPRDLPPAVTLMPVQYEHECSVAPLDQSDLEVPSPVCPDLRTPANLSLLSEVCRTSDLPYALDQQDIGDASCLSMSIEDWYDPELREIHSTPSDSAKFPFKAFTKKTSQYGEDLSITAMEEDVHTALQVLGFRRCKGDEEESDNLLSVFWPLW